MQLEDQIGVAASYVSSRDTHTGCTSLPSTPSSCNSLSKLGDKLDEMTTKITIFLEQCNMKSQSVNVYNSCNPNRPAMQDKLTQTWRSCSAQSDAQTSTDSIQLDINMDSEEIPNQLSRDLDSHLLSTHVQLTTTPSTCTSPASSFPVPNARQSSQQL